MNLKKKKYVSNYLIAFYLHVYNHFGKLFSGFFKYTDVDMNKFF